MNYFALISTLFAGFSVVAAMLLLFAYWFFLNEMRKSLASKWWCFAMMLGLVGLQCYHILYFVFNAEPTQSRAYAWCLLLMPICFYFFSRAVLFIEREYNRLDLLHLVPVLIGYFVPAKLVPLYAFFVGAGYTLWFVSVVIQLRRHKTRFRFELFFFSLFAAMAVVGLFLVAAQPLVSSVWFYGVYSNAISLSFMLIIMALLVFPNLVSDIAEIAENTYANSQLKSVDISAMQRKLEQLMIIDKRYQDETLNLRTLAKDLGLSGHQLSELINTEYGFGFPRFVREHRLRAAKALLVNELDASILAISMETGFRSQSAFYAAFKEHEGMSPGQYRAKNRPQDSGL